MVRARRRVTRSRMERSPQKIFTMPVMPGLSNRFSLAILVVTRTVRGDVDAAPGAGKVKVPLGVGCVVAPLCTAVPIDVTVPEKVCSGYALALSAAFCP